MKKHNGIISFWKFMFSMMILIFHFATTINSKYFNIGYLGVEFFFIVSGYFMTMKALNNKNEDCNNIGKNTWNYIWNKIKFLFPYILIAYIMSIFAKSLFRDFKTYQYIRSIWNLALIDMSGVVTTYMLGQTWYISAMLITIMILYPLLLKYKKNFIYIVSPLIVLLVGGYLSQSYGILNDVWIWTGFCFKGLLRAIFEMALGTIIYLVSNKMKNKKFTNIARWILTIIEVLGFVSIFIIANTQSKYYDFIAVALMAISIMIAFSEKSIFYNFANNKLFYYLEKLSLPIYLNHIWIKDIIVIKLTSISHEVQLILIVILTILFSMIIIFVIERYRKRTTEFIKKLMIKKDDVQDENELV